jgi:hypothetical protein
LFVCLFLFHWFQSLFLLFLSFCLFWHSLVLVFLGVWDVQRFFYAYSQLNSQLKTDISNETKEWVLKDFLDTSSSPSNHIPFNSKTNSFCGTRAWTHGLNSSTTCWAGALLLQLHTSQP